MDNNEKDDDAMSRMEDSDDDLSGNFQESKEWSMSTRSHLTSMQESHRDKVSISYSQSTGVDLSERKEASMTESTPLIHSEISAVLISCEMDKRTQAMFINEKPLKRSTKARRNRRGVWKNLTQSVQTFGEQTLNLAQQRAMMQSLSLPHIPSFDRKASSTLTFLNIQGMTFSVSTLALPYIVATAGLSGILSIILLGMISLYTCLIIRECQYEESKSKPSSPVKRIYSTFIEIGAAVLPGKIGGPLMKAATFSSLLSDVYVFILMGQSSVQLTKTVLPNLGSQEWILIWVALLLPLLAITRVSVLAWISFLSLIMFMVVVAIMYVMFFIQIDSWDVNHIPLEFSFNHFLVAYGVVLNSYNIHWSVPAVEASMAKDEGFKPILTLGFITNIILKVLFATLAVVTYGSATNQSVVKNLENIEIILFVGSAFTILALYFYFPMGMFVVFEMVDSYFRPHFPVFHGSTVRRILWLLLSRSVIVVFVIFLAVSCPDFGYVVSIIGCIRGTLVAVVLPLCAHVKLKWKELNPFVKILDIIIAFVCICLGLCGTYYAAKGIAADAA